MNLDVVIHFFSSIPTDWCIIGAIALVAAFDAVRTGIRKVCTVALALSVAVLIFSALPSAVVISMVLKQFSAPIVQSVIFAIILVASYLIVASIGIDYAGEPGQVIQSALAGVALAALIVTLWIATPAIESLWHFGPKIQEIFGETYRLWWLVGAYGALAFVRR